MLISFTQLYEYLAALYYQHNMHSHDNSQVFYTGKTQFIHTEAELNRK